MAGIQVLESRCTGCGKCVACCPFGAITCEDGKARVNAACKLCKLCVKQCPEAAIRFEERTEQADLTAYRDILVYVEHAGGRIHPITYELIGKAHELAAAAGYTVHAVLIGHALEAAGQSLRAYGLGKILLCDAPELARFTADAYAAALEAALRTCMPSAVLVGATPQGRSLAPRVATRLRTGLTADCTALEMRPNGELVQIRPAFGGNIMARIVTPRTRPQFATVHYKVFDRMPPSAELRGELQRLPLDMAARRSAIEVVEELEKPRSHDLSEAERIVVAGRGAQRKQDIEGLHRLAELLGAEMAYTRPLVENRVGHASRQIGLSGKTVKAKLILTFGVSGAIQFTAGMSGCERIIAVNSDSAAPIFDVAHVGIVADVQSFLPELIDVLKGGGTLEAL